jgi:hypothetical protein
MLRFVAPISLLVLAFAAPSADARGLTLKHASARLRACEQEQHTASFRASTWAWGKGTTLQMRFALQSRTKTDGDWVHSAPPEGFGVWLTANPGVQHYVVDKTLTKLAEGAAYRVVVKFRWRDASGAIVDHGVDRTRPCRQPDRRANLLVDGDWTELDFEGPPCNAGSSLAATTDTGGSVTESDETDNALTVPCPDSGAPPDVTIGHRL